MKKKILVIVLSFSMIFSTTGITFAGTDLNNSSQESTKVEKEIEEPTQEKTEKEEPKKEVKDKEVEKEQFQEKNKTEQKIEENKKEDSTTKVKKEEVKKEKENITEPQKQTVNYPIYVNWYIKSRNQSGKEITQSKLNQKISSKNNQKFLDLNSYSTADVYETKDGIYTFTGKWEVVCNDYKNELSPQKIYVGGTDCISSPTIRISNNANVTITAIYDKEDKIIVEPHTATVHINYMNQNGEWEKYTLSNTLNPGDTWTIMESAFDDDIDLVRTIYCNKKEYDFIGWNPQLPLTISNLTEDTEYNFTAQYTNKDLYYFNFNAIGKITTIQNNWKHSWTNSTNNSVFSNYTWNCKSPGNIPNNYLFEYWVNSEDENEKYKVGDKFTYNKELVKDTSITLHAVYQPITTIEYYDEENKIIDSVSNKKVDIYNNFQAPEKNGKFVGWYYDKERTQKVPDDTIKTLPLTQEKVQTTFKVYAKYTYTVTWENWDNTLLEQDLEVPYGKIPSYDSDEPKREKTAQHNYTFIGWDPIVEPVSDNITYVAQYAQDINKFKVIWQNWDGTILEIDKDVSYGYKPNYDGETPIKPDTAQFSYEFIGWDPEVCEVTDDIIYTAQYKEIINTYTVTWINYNNKVLEKDLEVSYGEMPSYNNTIPEKTATSKYTYEFTGWAPTIEKVTKDITYKAIFKAVLIPIPPQPDPNPNQEDSETITKTKTKNKTNNNNNNNTIWVLGENAGMGDEIEYTPVPTVKVPLSNKEISLIAPTEIGVWAFINLFTVLINFTISITLLLMIYINNRKEDEETEVKNKVLIRICTLIIAIISGIVFLFTEDMTLPMVLIDKWTPLMIIILVFNIIAAILSLRKIKEKEEAEEE